ncbi:CD276 antigen-like [Polyodon spathula]|uniref:CD276 antigen-like n=1 Tax=Polyodon spathula TaxID=7913 RepID=UPI001B7EAD9A|nr:CD276 antigen-like [Polyodon spathula]
MSPPGSDVTLSCSFSDKAGADLSRLVVTWQRPPVDHVVHSFYYGRDQLDWQNETYRNRTQLFPEQLSVGNASLRLKQVRGRMRAAPYSEPRLAIFLTSPGDHVTLIVKVADGYPRPTLLWLNAAGSDITNQSRTTQSLDSRGLYQIWSELDAVVNEAETFTFELDHSVMEQRVRQAVTLHPNTGFHIEQRSRLPVTFSLLLVLLLLIGVFLYGSGPAVTD